MRPGHALLADDMIAIARILLVYCEQNNRPINSLGLRRAKRLVGLSLRDRADGLRWERDKDWRMKLNAAGLDPDTLDVVNPLLWSRASAQLLETGTWDWRADEVYDEHYSRGTETFKARVTKKRADKATRRKAWADKMAKIDAKEKIEAPQQISQVQDMFRRKFGG
jgi:hypothetical protein